MKTIRLYLRSMKMLMKCQFEYPVSFFLQTLAQLIMEGGEMLAVILIINRFDRVNQWEAGDLFFFFGVMSVTFYLTECFGRGITGNFPYMIRSGQMDTVLLRPRGVLTQVLCSGNRWSWSTRCPTAGAAPANIPSTSTRGPSGSSSR